MLMLPISFIALLTRSLQRCVELAERGFTVSVWRPAASVRGPIAPKLHSACIPSAVSCAMNVCDHQSSTHPALSIVDQVHALPSAKPWMLMKTPSPAALPSTIRSVSSGT
eukprot:Amastigsp_a511737_8.p4 type:complete len:110 gc:universal Amastigsp_a511737_8:467-796(+)